MVLITRNSLPPKDQREFENMIAESKKNSDTLEYIAMMSDVDISEGDNYGSQQVLPDGEGLV